MRLAHATASDRLEPAHRRPARRDNPPRELRVSLGNDCSWTATADTATTIGYEATPPAACEDEPRLFATEEQVWLTDAAADSGVVPGICRCPETDELPVQGKIDDCRLTDPDHDGHPGLSLRTSADGAQSYVAYRNASTYVNGHVDKGGSHGANERRIDAFSFLSCEPSACSITAGRICPPERNPVQFVRLPSAALDIEWTCDDILSHLTELFPMPEPTPPTDC